MSNGDLLHLKETKLTEVDGQAISPHQRFAGMLAAAKREDKVATFGIFKKGTAKKIGHLEIDTTPGFTAIGPPRWG